ncbi:hypothetical protein CPC08DRAFT_57878 [Agrocybe pediades]|nr:hypothetical protein CPC08DRAFT_57878 [Agrocybe pediades]
MTTSSSSSSNPSFVRASLQLAKYIDIAITTPPKHQPFELADPDKPHYLRFYCSEAISWACRVLALKNGTDSLKNVTEQEFEDLVRTYKGKRWSKLSRQPPPPSYYDSDSDWDSGDEDDDDDLNYDSDAPPEYRKLDEDDLKYFFQQWKMNEEKEDLPKDVIGPLLDDPETHDFTVDILKEAFGISGGSDEEIKRDSEKILRSARLRFRAAHMKPFKYSWTLGPEDKELPPVLDNYSIFCNAVYSIRIYDQALVVCEQMKRDSNDTMSISHINVMEEVKTQLKCMRYTDELGHLPGFREASSRRARIYHVRHNKFMDVMLYITVLFDLQEKVRQSRFSQRPAAISDEAIKGLLTAVTNFKVYSTERLGKYYYPEVPAEFVKVSTLIAQLPSLLCIFILADSMQ